jgi:hypothetical protein
MTTVNPVIPDDGDKVMDRRGFLKMIGLGGATITTTKLPDNLKAEERNTGSCSKSGWDQDCVEEPKIVFCDCTAPEMSLKENILSSCDKEYGPEYRVKAQALADELLDTGIVGLPKNANEAYDLMRMCYKRVSANA